MLTELAGVKNYPNLPALFVAIFIDSFDVTDIFRICLLTHIKGY
jgi:hypothetical protein